MPFNEKIINENSNYTNSRPPSRRRHNNCAETKQNSGREYSQLAMDNLPPVLGDMYFPPWIQRPKPQ